MPSLQLAGTVTHLDIEGGVWVIRSGETNYNPMNLPERFRTEGLQIEAEAKRRDDIASISMVGPIIELVRIRVRESAESPPLIGTKWELIELPGHDLSDATRPTLEFAEDMAAHGSAGCNRFSGTAIIENSRIKFGPLATTRMFCGDPIITVETRYLDALQNAEQFEIVGDVLRVSLQGRNDSLRFRRVTGTQ